MNFYELSFRERLVMLGRLIWSLPRHPLLLGALIAIWGTAIVLAMAFGEPVATIAVLTALPTSVLMMQRAAVRYF